MTKEEINAALEAAAAKLKALQDTGRRIAKEQEEEFLKQVEDFFKPLLEYHPEVSLRKQYSGVSFLRHDKARYNKELATLSYNDWKKILELNTYTTIVSSNWELERLMFVGGLAKVVKEEKGRITALFTFAGPLEEKRSEVSNQCYALEREMNTYRQQLRDYERIEKISKLQTEGLEFEDPISLQAKWDWSFSRVCKLRIIKMTASGKSADIEVTTKIPQHILEAGDWVRIEDQYRTQVVEKVRMDNILYAIN